MEEKKYEIRHADPVNEILGRPPRPVLRWGNSLIFIVFGIFILFSWFIKYPDRIPAPVEITTANPPVTMTSKITGKIKYLYVKDRDNVKTGELLAVMETTASISDILRLKLLLDTVKMPEIFASGATNMFTELGELQSAWSTYNKSLSDYNNYISNDFYGSKLASVADEIKGIVVYISRVVVKENLFSQNQSLEAKKYYRDSALFSGGVISESDLEKSYQSLIRVNIELQQVRLDHSQKSIELAERKQLLQDYRIKRVEEKEKLYSALNEAFLNLKAQIGIWENTYLLTSPVNGIVTFTRFWSVNQSVAKDEPVLSIIPFETGDYVGRINLKMNRSGKVKTGQTVNIKLSGYPYLEYGMVRAVIKSKSLVPSGDAYIIELNLPDGLNTLYGKKLEFTQNMQGTAEIITDDLRLLQKIFNPLRHLITKNRQISISYYQNRAHNHHSLMKCPT